MAYSIVTKDGIKINNIPDDVPNDSPLLKARVAEERAKLGSSQEVGPPESLRPTAAQIQAQETGPLEAAVVGVGRGLTTFARGAGLDGAGLEQAPTPRQEAFGVAPAASRPIPESAPLVGDIPARTPAEEEAFAALKEARPITAGGGEIVGEAAVPVGAAVLTGGVGGLGTQIPLQTAIGATEGAILARGGGATSDEIIEGAGIGGGIALGAEVLFPVIGRLGGAIVRRITGRAPKGALIDATGKPTPELTDALRAEGRTFDDLSQEAVETIQAQPRGAAPEQAARIAEAGQENIPLTTGQARQDFTTIRGEEELRGAVGAGGEKIRQFDLVQSEAIDKALQDLGGTTGLEKTTFLQESGQLIKDALTGRKKLLRKQKNELYRKAGEIAEEKGGIPIFTDGIEDAIPDAKTLRRIRRLKKGQSEAVDDLLTEFGFVTDDATVKAFVESGGEITPLTLENAEDFRQALGQIERADVDNTINVVTGPIKDALDKELDAMFDVFKDEAGFPTDLLETLGQARATTRQLKTEFSPQSLAGKLINSAKDGVTEIKDASQIYDFIAQPSTSIENVAKTVGSLREAGEEGAKALEALKTTVVLDLLEAGFGTKSKQVSGVQIFNPIAFRNRLAAINKKGNKLEILFGGDKAALDRLKNIENVAKTITPPDRATLKGSADFAAPLLRRLLGVVSGNPLGAAIIEAGSKTGGEVVRGVKARKAVSGAPEVAQITSELERTFPSLAAALGIVVADKQENTK